MFYSFDLLVGFMALARHEHDVLFLRHHARGLDSLFPVDHHQSLARFGWSHTFLHFTDDLHRIFVARIIGCKNYLIAILTGDRSHQRALGLIAISTTADHRDHLLLAGTQL